MTNSQHNQPPLTPEEILHEYLEGCADSNSSVDAQKLIAALHDGGYVVIRKSEWETELRKDNK